MMELMREMLQKQSELIDTMHQKAVADTKDGTEVTAKKPPQPNTERKKSEDGFYINDGEKIVHIEPTWQWRLEGENDMERLMRTNLQFARLIDENAELRREKLLRDMVIQAENKKKQQGSRKRTLHPPNVWIKSSNFVTNYVFLVVKSRICPLHINYKCNVQIATVVQTQ